MAEEKNYVTLEDVQSTRQEEEEPSNLNNDNNNGANDVADTSAIPLNPYAYLFTSERFKKEVRGLPKYYGIGDFSPSQDVIEVLSIEKTEYESDEEQAETGSNNEPPGPGGAPPEQYPVGRGPPGGRGSPQHFGWGGGHQPWQNRQHPTDQVQVNPATGQPDYSIQWAEYYRSLGMHREAEMIEQQAEASKGLAGPGQPQQGAGPQPQQQPAGPGPQAVTTQNGQPDYSAQWAEYYRSIGKIKEAEALEVQMKAGKVGQAGPGGPQPGAPESQ